MNISLDDLEKALRYARKASAVMVSIEVVHDNTSKVLIGVSEAYKGSGAKITIFSAEAKKMPEITKTETLFE